MAVEKTRSVHVSFFFVDIVGLSNPETPTVLQAKKINFLNNSIATCKAFMSVPADSVLILPTGDGMAIGFLQGPELPLQLAIELHEKLSFFNRGKLPNEIIQVRIGINSGPVLVVKDIRGNDNIWGPGIIMARRIMDVGDEGHILLSSRVAEDLRQISHEYSQIIHPLEKYTLKHEVHVLVYSAYGKNFGNSALPAKIRGRMNEFLYPWVVVSMMILDSDTMRVHYKRTYELQNLSDIPLHAVTHQIATDEEKSLSDLNIRIYDERDRPLTISNIELNTSYQKLFSTSLAKPLSKGEKVTYTLEYDVEETRRYFENAFYANCEKFILIFDYPAGQSIKPVLFEVNPETEQQDPAQVERAETSESGRIINRWQLDNVSKGRILRIEW